MIREFHDSIMMAIKNGKILNGQDGKEVIDYYREWTHNSIVDRLKIIQPPLFQEFNRKIKILFQDHRRFGENYNVLMPWQITTTNSYERRGDTVYWNVDQYDIFLEDYAMVAESRVTNVWAFVITGMMVFGLFGFFVMKCWKRRGSRTEVRGRN